MPKSPAYQFIMLLLLISTVSGCGQQGRMVNITFDDSGKKIQTIYSDIYESRQLLIPDKLGIQVIVQDKKITGLGYYLKQKLGVLGPDDLDSPADCMVLVFNRKKEPLHVTITDIQLNDKHILTKPTEWNLKEMQTKSLTMHDLKIPSYDTELKFQIRASMDRQLKQFSLILQRLSERQADALFTKWSKRDKNVDEFFSEGIPGTHDLMPKDTHATPRPH